MYTYIIELEQGKYYVGQTIYPTFSLETHFNYRCSAWTRVYSPIRIVEIIPDCDLFDTDKYTIKYMKKYGIENVRGGSFCRWKLYKSDIVTLQRMIADPINSCYMCGGNHSVHECSDCNELNEHGCCWDFIAHCFP